MPKFESKQGRKYEVDGRYMTWHPESWDDEPALPDLRIPLRIKVGVVLQIAEGGKLDNARMRATLLAVVPAAEAVVEEMDLNDFQDMFTTWMDTYNSLTGVSLGESSPSAASSPSTGGRPSTTSARSSRSRSK